jgi:amino acid transporter
MSIKNFKLRTGRSSPAGLPDVLLLMLGTTDQVIILAALGAVVMYMISMVALFALRSKEPHLERPFSVPFYPLFSGDSIGFVGYLSRRNRVL